jgi:hypothetical protein
MPLLFSLLTPVYNAEYCQLKMPLQIFINHNEAKGVIHTPEFCHTRMPHTLILATLYVYV